MLFDSSCMVSRELKNIPWERYQAQPFWSANRSLKRHFPPRPWIRNKMHSARQEERCKLDNAGSNSPPHPGIFQIPHPLEGLSRQMPGVCSGEGVENMLKVRNERRITRGNLSRVLSLDQSSLVFSGFCSVPAHWCYLSKRSWSGNNCA